MAQDNHPMNKTDSALLNILIKDGRTSYADIARQLNVSRAYARTRVNALVEEDIIEQFTVVVNPEKLGKVISTFVDVKARPQNIEVVARELAARPEVVSLHIHTLTDSYETFNEFVRTCLFERDDIISVESSALLKRVKHRRGGARL
jgi:DNA-binding Lrp family transcriptional regulator